MNRKELKAVLTEAYDLTECNCPGWCDGTCTHARIDQALKDLNQDEYALVVDTDEMLEVALGTFEQVNKAYEDELDTWANKYHMRRRLNESVEDFHERARDQGENETNHINTVQVNYLED